MSKKQKSVMLAINIYVLVFLMTFITRVVTAYIGIDYPEISSVEISNLVTFPSFFGMAAALVIGPLSLKFGQVKLANMSILFMVLHCVVYYLVGMFHAPFWMLHFGSFFGGVAIGSYIPLLNSIISKHFPADRRANCIAQYNVFINIGGVVITYAAGWLAAPNDGAQWYNAYLLGIAAIIGVVVFVVLTRKLDLDTPSIAEASAAASGPKAKISDIPGKVFAWIILMGVVHGLFYVTQNAFNVNASPYIITEYQLGTSVEAGTATSLVRFALIPFTALYPVFKKILKDWMIPVGYLCMAIGLAIMMVSKSLVGAYACAVFCGLSTALVHSEFYAKASRYVPVALVAVATSVVSFLVNVGTGFSSYVLNFFSNMLGGGMENSFLAGIIISVVIAVAALFMYVIKKPVQQVD